LRSNAHQIVNGCNSQSCLLVIVESNSLGYGIAPPDGLHLGLGVGRNVNFSAFLSGLERDLLFLDRGVDALLVDVGDQRVAVERSCGGLATPKSRM